MRVLELLVLELLVLELVVLFFLKRPFLIMRVLEIFPWCPSNNPAQIRSFPPPTTQRNIHHPPSTTCNNPEFKAIADTVPHQGDALTTYQPPGSVFLGFARALYFARCPYVHKIYSVPLLQFLQ